MTPDFMSRTNKEESGEKSASQLLSVGADLEQALMALQEEDDEIESQSSD